MTRSTSRFARILSKGLLLAGIALVPALASTSASAQDKMSGSKMSGSKMSGSKMSGSKMSGSKMSGSKMSGSKMSGSKMMMGKMSASDKRTYAGMSASEKALMMKMMHGKM